MATYRRVVTGHRADGKSIIASDEKVAGAGVPSQPSSTLVSLWGADEPLTYPDAGGEPQQRQWFPQVGGFRFISHVMAPDGAAPVDGDPEAAATQAEQLFPGMMVTMFPDEPGMGMHRSATIDFGYVVSRR